MKRRIIASHLVHRRPWRREKVEGGMESTRAQTPLENTEAQTPKSVQVPGKTDLEKSMVQPSLTEPSENDSWSAPWTTKMKTDCEAGAKSTCRLCRNELHSD
ncbi:hypothetical protein NDU88_006043 [Pleurodeles waltl]|uniref:Uncharacterized protein n=1 Tax=Pleurodeles waltl TaxID=8319 RepID=A0AAV7TW23_PLEWA|nr:hypothetical protein NDU88_006043 [Pleurodeles waltl]